MSEDINRYPGGSKSLVNRAGNNVRHDKLTDDDLRIIDEWRAAHRTVLNTFQAILRNRTRDKDITVAQRHKRRRTIFDKLRRFPEMQLSRMDDVAGCRLIFDSIDELYKFRREFHKAKFKHNKKNQIDKYDYIKSPKTTGYRSVHDVYEYNVQSKSGKASNGLFVEIQYRTLIQHAWATAVELIGSVTENQPKFQRGDKRYEEAMAFASEILARAFEELKGPFPDLENSEIVRRFKELDREIKLIKLLKGLNAAEKAVSKNRNIILILSKDGRLEFVGYENSKEAIVELFNLEINSPEKDVVLVSAESSDQIRLAFKNYFSDARDFLRWIQEGSRKLLGKNEEGLFNKFKKFLKI